MLPKTHAILGAVFSLLIYFIFHLSFFNVILIFLASVFIDSDHYLWYVYIKKSINLKNAYYWFREKREKWLKLSKKEKEDHKRVYLIFHCIEFWIVLLALSLTNKIFLFILIGVLFHMIFDYIEILYLKEKLYPKFSLIYIYFKNKDKKHFYS
jgi:hypothetical protein